MEKSLLWVYGLVWYNLYMKMTQAKLEANRINGLLGGRPKGTLEETTLFKRAIKRAILEKVWLKAGEMTDSMIKEAIKGSAVAFTAVMDRAIDKPAQAVEMSGKDGNPIVFMPLELIAKHSLDTPQELVDVNSDVINIDSTLLDGSV